MTLLGEKIKELARELEKNHELAEREGFSAIIAIVYDETGEAVMSGAGDAIRSLQMLYTMSDEIIKQTGMELEDEDEESEITGTLS